MITEEQRKGRMKGLGSSDMAAVMGLCRYRTAMDVWLVKTGRAEDFSGNENTKRGDYMEHALMAYAEEELGHPLRRNITLLDPDGGPLAANLDGLCDALGANIEGKSISGDIDPLEWGEPGSDQVPDNVLIQTHVAMICGKLLLSYVPVILPIYERFDLRMFRIEFNATLAGAIREQAARFWNEHVLKDVPPVNSVASLEVLKRIKRIPSTVAEISDDLVDRWTAAKEAASAAEKEAKEWQAKVLGAMTPIDADGAVTETGRMISYLPTDRKGYTVEPTTYRTLRLVGAKRAKKMEASHA